MKLNPAFALVLFSLLISGTVCPLPCQPPRSAEMKGKDPWVGTWVWSGTLWNKDGSKFEGRGVFKSETITIEAQGAAIKIRIDIVDGQGKAVHLEFVTKDDGKDYPVTGDGSIDAVSNSRVDERTVRFTYKKAGTPVMSGTNVISADGRTMTTTFGEKDQDGQVHEFVAHYDKKQADPRSK